MALTIQNSKGLVHPDRFKTKILLIAQPGFGKTEFIGGVPNIGIAATETGDGNGMLTIAERGVDYVEPETLTDLEAVCKGQVFKTHSAQALDSLTAMSRTFIRKAALAIPRKQGDSEKRRRGVPELDDYGVIAVMIQDLLRQLIQLDKHIIVTAQLKVQMPDAETGRGEYLVGPDLPGQMFLGAPAMFDQVFIGRTRNVTRDIVNDKGITEKKKVTERYWITAPDGIHLAKCRSKRLGNQPLLPQEVVYDLKTGSGTWQYMYEAMRAGYEEVYASLHTSPSVND